jgi:hypothetical protein
LAEYEECVVTFLDVLGFRALLRSESADQIAKILNILRSVSKPDTPLEVTRSDEFRIQSEAVQEIISDAVVRARTLNTKYRDGAFIWEIIDLLHIQIECIANGVLLRGAVTIGDLHIGQDLKGPVFGTALVRAYEMESDEVVYPRIAIDETALARHRTDASLWREGHELADEVEHLQRLLKQDESGLHFIDYLGACFDELDNGFVGLIEFLGAHKDIIEKGISASKGNQKVSRKYNWLKLYHNRYIETILSNPIPEEFSDDLERPADDILRELLI